MVQSLHRRVRRNRSMEEPSLAHVDPPEEAPVAIEGGMQHIEERRLAIALLENRVELGGPEHEENHLPVVVSPSLRYARCRSNDAVAAVTTDQIVAMEVSRIGFNENACFVLVDIPGLHAQDHLHVWHTCGSLTKHLLGQILR